MAKKREITDMSVEEILNPMHTRDEKHEIIEYFRNLQNAQNQAVEMVATQQVTCNCNHPAVAAPNGEQQPSKAPKQEAQVVILPSTPWMELQPFKTLAKLSITDWLLVVIAILLFINIIRRK